MIVEGTIKPMAEKDVTVVIATNAEPGDMPPLHLTLVGARTAPLLLETPPALSFGIVPAGGGQPSETFEILTLEETDKPPWIGEIVPSTLALDVKLVGMNEADSPEGTLIRSYRYEVRVPSVPLPPGDYSDVLAIYRKPSSEGRPLAEVPVSLSVRSAVYAAPARVRLLKAPGHRDPTGILLLQCVDPDVSLECEPAQVPPGIEAVLLERSRARSTYRLTARAGPPIEGPATITFRTNHPDAPRIDAIVDLPILERKTQK